jgi:membrane protease YdiL (CAAX protease family)
MKKEISLIILLILPCVTAFFTMKWTKDACITILALTLLCYSLACFLYDKLVADFKWSWFVGKETNNCCSKIFDGIGFTLLFGVIIGTALIVFTMFSEWGLGEKMILPVPHFGNFWDTVYMSILAILYIVVLPLGEEAFYRVFQANQWKGMLSDIMISFFYAVMNLGGVYYVFDSWTPRWILTGFAFLIGVTLVYLRDKTNVVYSLMARIGVALGVFVWLCFLIQTVKSAMPRAQPQYFFIANVENIFGSH